MLFICLHVTTPTTRLQRINIIIILRIVNDKKMTVIIKITMIILTSNNSGDNNTDNNKKSICSNIFTILTVLTTSCPFTTQKLHMFWISGYM